MGRVKSKPVLPRAQANGDVDDAIAYYLRRDARPAVLGFIDQQALEAACTQSGLGVRKRLDIRPYHR
ncbi:hypothetical protein Acife_3088 [Acidithiobacillus ferrivorans SS3]|uniref:Uncharacterized protein n=1 Tax=Acidithiobacillus ferrivorans SS3 TaxID=743299 RepID=G0JL45_9PROT|nr:hypothetical protein [Acidithiobacillus ferrivorans]AEM49160.1 hypothetical protein Acife_3088 [Acidithiobacillus ferrivorans SS3]OFA14815.1 hypothetical protein A4U49_16340 [Acidithiobacillus ferrivorans]